MVPENKADGLKRLGSFPGCDNSKIDPFEGGVEVVPKKKTPVRNPWTKEDLRQLKAHSKTRTPVVEVEGDETNRGGGPTKGEDNRHRSWSSPVKTVALIDSSTLERSSGNLGNSSPPIHGGARGRASRNSSCVTRTSRIVSAPPAPSSSYNQMLPSSKRAAHGSRATKPLCASTPCSPFPPGIARSLGAEAYCPLCPLQRPRGCRPAKLELRHSALRRRLHAGIDGHSSPPSS
jgi:hypothetical protein